VDAALDRSPFGMFVLDGSGRVRRTNRMADRILADRLGLCVLGGRLYGTHGAGARRLAELIAQAASPDPEVRSGGSMILRVLGRRAPLSIIVTPVQSARSAVFGHAPGVLVCVTDPDAQGRASADQLKELFCLTPAEARVALALLDGADTREAAQRLGVSFHTVRHQVQSMLDKTGAARQSDLVALLTRATLGPIG
jgi:DNA-binding CsgD family transcriptional regulator